jgi:hypothetical protein
MDFDRHPPGVVINARQADALARLLRDGEQAGTVNPRVDPPGRVALASVGELLPALDQGDNPAGRTLAVLADDDRAWQITVRGITWALEQASE